MLHPAVVSRTLLHLIVSELADASGKSGWIVACIGVGGTTPTFFHVF